MAKRHVKGFVKHPVAIAAVGTIIGLTTWTVAGWLFANAANNTLSRTAATARAQSTGFSRTRGAAFMGMQPQTNIFPR